MIRHVKSLRRDVIFVRNPNFRHTTTLQSFFLAGRELSSSVICLDGDMIIEENSFRSFQEQCGESPLVGISAEISEDPVYSFIEGMDNDLKVTGFGRTPATSYEWANLAFIPSPWLAFEQTHFYEKLEQYLPLTAKPIHRVEIDTPQDLEAANNLLKNTPGYCPYLMQNEPCA